MSKVMIHPATYAKVHPAVDRVFECFPLELKGKKILVKPNVLRVSQAEEGIATHPAVLRAVVDKIETMQPESIVVGELKQLPDFKLPPLGGEASTSNKALHRRLHDLTLLRPQADPELCSGCGTCVDQCAASALSMNGNLPRVDADKCITCFCCQEICPEKAMTLK